MWGEWSLCWRSFQAPVHTTLEIFENSFISTVWPAVHTIRLKKTDIYGNALENRRIWKRCLFVFKWTENSLKKELFESDVVTIIIWFSCSTFPQTIQTKRSSLRFSLAWYERKHLIRFQSRETSSCTKRKPPTKKVTSAIGSIPCYWV